MPKQRRFKGYLRFDWIELPNNDFGLKSTATGDWANIHKITNKPRRYFVSCYLRLESGSLHHVNISFHDKSKHKQDIKILMRKAFDIAKQDVTENVLLLESYFIVTA